MAETLFPVTIKRKTTRYDKPKWARDFPILAWEDLTPSLPTTAIHQGYRLRFVEYDRRDPVILYDRNRRLVHEWAYVPSLTEVFELCQQLKILTKGGQDGKN